MNERLSQQIFDHRGNWVARAFCQLCGRPIKGSPKTYQHQNWPKDMRLRICNECDRDRPRCRICNIPMFESTSNHTCRTCSESLDFCLTCGDPILGKYLEFDGVGPYCLKCARDRQPCDICSAPLTDDRWKLSDERILCLYCHATAIVDKEHANELYEQMKSVANQLLGLSLNVPTGLALVDRNQLAIVIQQQRSAVGSDGQASLELDPERTLGLYVRKGMRRGLYVQAGLPRSLFLQVAAHEFTHAWQGENCPLLKDQEFHEGFAEWVAYQILGYFGYTQGQKRMISREDVYGKGLRHIIDLFAEVGLNGILEACKRMI